jgi:hypothetical protein
MTDDRRYRLAVLSVFLLALAMRTLPLWLSPLPFKADGLFYAADTAATLSAGRFPLEGMATDDLGFTPLLVAVAGVTGVDPWLVAQPVSSLLGALPVLLVTGVTRRICRHRGWPTGRSRLAALLAGAFLAVEGLYLHRSMVTDEQTAGLFVVPLALLALHRAAVTDRCAWWVAGVALLALLPPLHNLDAMVTAIALTALVGWSVVRQRLNDGFLTLAGVTAAFWVVFPAYHVLVERFTPADIIQEARFTDVPGLVVAWMVAGVLVLAWATRLRPRTQRVAGWSLFGVMFGLIALNASKAVFPEMPTTPPVVLAMLLPLAIPAALAAWRGPDLQGTGDGPAMLAQGAATVIVIGISLTAALTPVYLGTAYRTSLFLHVPVAIPVGLGTAARMANDRVAPRPALRVAVATVVLVSAVVSVPLSFGGLAPFTYRAVTPPGELAATEFAASHVDGQWATDDHVRRVASARSDDSPAVGPVYAWLVDGRPPPDCPALVKRSLTTRGTQFLTTGVVTVPSVEYRHWLATSNVVYDGGSQDRIALGLPPGHVSTCGTASGR